MRFLAFVWLTIALSLSLFTFVMLSHQVLAPGLSPVDIRALLLLSAWGIGLTSAGAIHLLYRRAERALAQAARDETIVQLAGAVAHELNQPLTVVISSAELISRRDHSHEEIVAVAGRMVEASERMADIVVKLQRATCYRAKPYVGKVQIVDLDKAS